MYTGKAFNSRLIAEYGSSTEKYRSASLWIRTVSPVAPPGNNSPVRTRTFILNAIITAAKITTMIRFRSFLTLICIVYVLQFGCSWEFRILYYHTVYQNPVRLTKQAICAILSTLFVGWFYLLSSFVHYKALTLWIVPVNGKYMGSID